MPGKQPSWRKYATSSSSRTRILKAARQWHTDPSNQAVLQQQQGWNVDPESASSCRLRAACRPWEGEGSYLVGGAASGAEGGALRAGGSCREPGGAPASDCLQLAHARLADQLRLQALLGCLHASAPAGIRQAGAETQHVQCRRTSIHHVGLARLCLELMQWKKHDHPAEAPCERSLRCGVSAAQ